MNGTTKGTGATQLVGVVEAVNPKGIRLEGREGWVNFSKFAPDLVPPERGQVVTVTLDRSGFVRAIAPAAPTDAPQVTGGASASRETAITRLAVLKAAAEFAAGRPDVKSGDVLTIAERWEGWVLR